MINIELDTKKNELKELSDNIRSMLRANVIDKVINREQVTSNELLILQALNEIDKDFNREINEDIVNETYNSKKHFSDYLYNVKNEKEQILKTNINRLDDLLQGGFRQGITFLGGVASIGKSTLVQQIAENVAEQGTYVIYFTLEMNKKMMYSKGLSRVLKEHFNTSFSAQELSEWDTSKRTKEENEIRQKAIEYYSKNIVNNIVYIDFNRIPTIEKIEEVVKRHININNDKPLIVIDYLQLIKVSDTKKFFSDKQIIDHVSTRLLEMTNTYNLTTICISALNRESYKNNEPNLLNLSCFKESGNLEYSAVYSIVLQFSKVREEIRQKRENSKYKVSFNEYEEKEKAVRDVEFCILKSRKGTLGYTNFKYYAKENYFSEWTQGEHVARKEKEVFKNNDSMNLL